MSDMRRVEAVPVTNDIGAGGHGKLYRGSTAGFDLLIVQFADRIFATEDRCPHRGARLSTMGRVTSSADGPLLECAEHNYAYSFESGQCLRLPRRAGPWPPGALEVYEAEQAGEGAFFVRPSGRLARHLRNTEPMEQRTRCLLCGDVAVSLPLEEVPLEIWTMYPIDALTAIRNARTFRHGNVVLLHHTCSSAAAGNDTPYWDFDRAWWACADPGRPLDGDTHFDINCMDCARRWSREGSERA